MKNKRTGIFIDIQIIQNVELDWENKVLLSEIISLDKLSKGCIASNQTLADFLQIKRQSIHRRIKFLVDNGYITTVNQYSGGKCIGRIIYPTGKLVSAQASVMSARADTVTAHADTMEAQADTNDSVCFHTMTAESNPIISVNNSYNSVTNSECKTGTNTEDFDEHEKQLKIILTKFNLS